MTAFYDFVTVCALPLQVLWVFDKDRFNAERVPDKRHQCLDTQGFRGIVAGDKKVHAVFLCRIVHGQIDLADEKTTEPVNARLVQHAAAAARYDADRTDALFSISIDAA